MFGVPTDEIAAIALGSNLGESEKILQGAIAALGQLAPILNVSPFYITKPIGPAQPDYLNGCLLLHYSGQATTLMQRLLDIENDFGRIRTLRWGARTLDLDLLFKGPEILNTDFLTLPHPRMHERGFVLVPLADIYADWLHPVQQQSVRQLLSKVPQSDITSAT